MHANSLGAVADIFDEVFFQTGNRPFPLYITPTMARGRIEMWSLIDTRRVKRDGRSTSTPNMDMADLSPSLPIFWYVMDRNLDRARRRYLRACGALMDSGDAMLDAGAIMPEPSVCEHPPAEKDISSALPRLSDVIRCSSDPRYTAWKDGIHCSADTPFLVDAPILKAPGGPLYTALDNPEDFDNEWRASQDVNENKEEIKPEGFGLPHRDDATIRLSLNQEARN